MCYIELDPCELWREETRRARKVHRCSICLRVILIGERYVDHFSLDSGVVCKAKVCAECEADRQTFAAAHDREYGASLVQPPGFAQLLADCIAEGDEESETRWKPMLTAIQARRT